MTTYHAGLRKGPVAPARNARPWLTQNLETHDERQRREEASFILRHSDQLTWQASRRNESVAQTRLHFTAILCGLQPPTSKYKNAPYGTPLPSIQAPSIPLRPSPAVNRAAGPSGAGGVADKQRASPRGDRAELSGSRTVQGRASIGGSVGGAENAAPPPRPSRAAEERAAARGSTSKTADLPRTSRTAEESRTPGVAASRTSTSSTPSTRPLQEERSSVASGGNVHFRHQVTPGQNTEQASHASVPGVVRTPNAASSNTTREATGSTRTPRIHVRASPRPRAIIVTPRTATRGNAAGNTPPSNRRVEARSERSRSANVSTHPGSATVDVEHGHGDQDEGNDDQGVSL